jgi:uncharacterized membrane protein
MESDALTTPAVTAPAGNEPRWHASIAVLVILILYYLLPGRLTIGPIWILPLLVLGILVPLSILAPNRQRDTALTRAASIALIVIVNAFNVISVALLVHGILYHGKNEPPLGGDDAKLLIAGSQIWATNILVFALWYWEIDNDGPDKRASVAGFSEFRNPDFLFTPMILGRSNLQCLDPNWKPRFADYLYLAFTNALAFSPTDTFPITIPGKFLMTAQAIISFVTIAIVVARAVGALQ